mmetsp:Transcript_37216/g.90402  ORF Transcript_37216/g.90402 Transcript_37216/m.90402 type:complete len:81 (+) Transcript_37216:2485-2727(+)
MCTKLFGVETVGPDQLGWKEALSPFDKKFGPASRGCIHMSDFLVCLADSSTLTQFGSGEPQLDILSSHEFPSRRSEKSAR